jgi:hypothetical protein
MMIMFVKSRASSYEAAVRIAKGASHYEEGDPGPHNFHIAGFRDTAMDLARALTLCELLHGIKGSQFVVNGRAYTHSGQFLGVLHCAQEASRCSDYRAHCHRVWPQQFNSDGYTTTGKIDGLRRSESVSLACAYASNWSGWKLTGSHPSSLSDQFHDVVVRRGCDWCPRYRKEDTRII